MIGFEAEARVDGHHCVEDPDRVGQAGRVDPVARDRRHAEAAEPRVAVLDQQLRSTLGNRAAGDGACARVRVGVEIERTDDERSARRGLIEAVGGGDQDVGRIRRPAIAVFRAAPPGAAVSVARQPGGADRDRSTPRQQLVERQQGIAAIAAIAQPERTASPGAAPAAIGIGKPDQVGGVEHAVRRCRRQPAGDPGDDGPAVPGPADSAISANAGRAVAAIAAAPPGGISVDSQFGHGEGAIARAAQGQCRSADCPAAVAAARAIGAASAASADPAQRDCPDIGRADGHAVGSAGAVVDRQLGNSADRIAAIAAHAPGVSVATKAADGIGRNRHILQADRAIAQGAAIGHDIGATGGGRSAIAAVQPAPPGRIGGHRRALVDDDRPAIVGEDPAIIVIVDIAQRRRATVAPGAAVRIGDEHRIRQQMIGRAVGVEPRASADRGTARAILARAAFALGFDYDIAAKGGAAAGAIDMRPAARAGPADAACNDSRRPAIAAAVEERGRIDFESVGGPDHE